MDFSDFTRMIAIIAKDSQSSAMTLASKSIDVYIEYLTCTLNFDNKIILDNLIRLSDLLCVSQPSITPLTNIVDLVLSKSNVNANLFSHELRQDLICLLSDLKTKLVNNKYLIAENALSYFPDNAIVITLSDSSTVEVVLKKAYLAGKLSKVIVAESRPLLEGLNFANRLLDFGIPVTIVVDAGLGFFSKNATFALVGADTVQSDGSLVHKIGTYPLALACYDLGKSFYVVCDTLKFSKTATINQPVKIEQKSPTEIVNKNKLCNAEIKNIYFDITPAKLVTEIITEEKKFKPNRKNLDKKNKSGCY